ncbi:MAG: outer membrane protein assembly factor BamB family protein [Gemmatimonadaceae bacterium]
MHVLRAVPWSLLATAALAGAVASCDLFTGNDSQAALRLCWRTAQRTGITLTPPAVSGDVVAFGEGDGTITAREIRSGAVRWATRVDTAAPLGMNMPISGGLVVVPVAGYTVALDLLTGRERWRYEAPLDVRENPSAPKPGYVGGNRVAIDQSLVFIPAWGASVSAVEISTGRAQWIWKPADSIPNRSGAEGVALSGDTVYATVWHYVNPLGGRSEPWLVALDRATGRELWRLAFPSYTSGNVTTGGPVIHGDLVIFSTIGGHEFAVNRFTQQVVWGFTPNTQQATFAQTQLHDGLVYHDGGDRFLYALRAGDGTVVWKTALHNQPNVDFVVTSKYIYVTDDPKLLVIDRASGRRVFEIDELGTSSGRFNSSVAVSGGRIFIASATAAMCFHEPR